MRLIFLTRLHDSEIWSNYRPRIPIAFYLLALAGVVITISSFWLRQNDQIILGIVALVLGIALIVPLVVMAVLVRRMRNYRTYLREQMLDSIDWHGDEHVLDIACGSGMMLNGAAQRLTSGKALGIDMWAAHAGGGDYDMLMNNARAEGVADRIEFKQVDALHMPFDDASFDVVMCNGAVHHIIHGHVDFEKLMGEMTRVLKPGGRLALRDVTHIIEVSAPRLQQAGIACEVKPTASLFGFSSNLLIGKKAG